MNQKLKELADRQAALDQKIESVTKSTTTSNEEKVFGSPYVRKGENSMSSRGFQFQRLLGAMTGVLQPEHAKLELDVCERLRQALVVNNKFAMQRDSKFMAPLGTDFLCGDEAGTERGIDDQFRHEIKSLCLAGVGGNNQDLDEIAYIGRKAYGMKSQSWLDETLGGALVAPPEFGELIQLLRNKEAVINAGARVVPLPPSGRLKYPRQTSPTTAYHVGENTQITTSNFGTGSLILSAKKIGALVSLPNELIRFASPMSEALLRADLTKTLALQMDKDLLEGEGSDNITLGLMNVPNTATVTPTTTASAGNTLSPQDLYLFPSAVEENNGEFQSWILRPVLFYNFVAARAGVYNGSTVVANGQFIYDQFRQFGSQFGKVLLGYPAVTTPQVSITRVKGSGSNLTYVIGGQFDDYILAMFGSIEFAEATQGDTAFANDQTVVRAILTFDGAPRHPGVFAIADTVLQTVGN